MSLLPASKLFISLLFFSTVGLAQFPLSFGIKGGVPLTDSLANTAESSPGFTVNSYSASKNYVVGPMVELRLPFHLGIEADALYRPISVVESSNPVGLVPSFNGSDGSWEFPIVAKYRFGFPIVKPYVEAGPSFRSQNAQPLNRLSSDGVAIGVGVDFHLLLLHIAPEMRYTRWGSDSTASTVTQFIRSNQNQVEFLVGLTF